MSSQQHPTPAAGPTPTDLVRAARARVVEEDREGAVELLARAIGVTGGLPKAWEAKSSTPLSKNAKVA